MKKLLAALLAMMMLTVCFSALAEETPAADENAQPIEETILNFDITMDQIPEGYSMTKVYDESVAYVVFTPDEEEGAIYTVGISPDESAEGMVLPDELTEDEQAAIIEAWCVDWNAPTLRMMQTSHGTNVVCLEDNDADGDLCDLVSCYNGYIIMCDIWMNGEISDEDVARGLQILSDMWIVDAQ